MSKRGKIIIVFALSIVAMTLFTGIVSAATYTLSGRVTNQSGTPLDAVTIEVLDPGTGTIVASAATDATGNYTLTIDEGTYDMRVVPPAGSGFAESLSPGQIINSDTNLDFALVPAGLVTVSGRVVDRDGKPLIAQKEDE